MKTLAILGANGMLGSDLVKYLGQKFIITSIDKKNYELQKNKSFDIFINANGNSRRYWANENPNLDFIASTVSVHKTMLDFKCDLYIYISSIDVYGNRSNPKNTKETIEIHTDNLQPYGFHKYLSEIIVRKYKSKFLIIRPSYILGTKIKKGPIFDLLNNQPLFITDKSKFQLISSKAISEIIEVLTEKKIKNTLFNVGGIGTFKFKDARKYFNVNPKLLDNIETQIYEMNTGKLKSIYKKLKTSEQYLIEYINDVNYKK